MSRHPAIDDVAPDTLDLKRFRRETPEQCAAIVLRLTHHDVARRRLGEKARPLEQRGVLIESRIRATAHREHGPSDLHPRLEGENGARQDADGQAHVLHDVMHERAVTCLETIS
jgi:hypothetical protein